MPQRLKMPHALYGLRDRLFVYNTACIQADIHTKTLCHQTPQHLDLHLAHNLHLYLLCLLIPGNVNLRLLLLKLL